MDGYYYYPFFEIRSKALKEMLNVKDNRTVVKKLEEIGVKIYRKGKSRYIISDEVIDALKQENYSGGYIAKGKYAKLLV